MGTLCTDKMPVSLAQIKKHFQIWFKLKLRKSFFKEIIFQIRIIPCTITSHNQPEDSPIVAKYRKHTCIAFFKNNSFKNTKSKPRKKQQQNPYPTNI